MGIHIGVVCEGCGKVYFVNTSPNITPSPKQKGMYQLICKAPCLGRRQFRKEEMFPFRVSASGFARGYASLGEYELIPKKSSHDE